MSEWMKEMERLVDEHDPIPECDCKRCAITERDRLRAALLAHAAQRDHTEDVLGMVQSVELPEPEAIERIATTRYRCVPIRLFGYKVVSGDGDRSLFEGTKDECYVVARKLTEAFLDGAHVAFRQMHQYGDAREAAGYARGVAEERERCAAICDRMGNPLNVKYEGGGCRKAAAAIRAAQKGDEL